MREVAILLSHLRAIAAGRELLRDTAARTHTRHSHFLVIEEDAELGLMLASRHEWLTSVISSLPKKWSVLQVEVWSSLRDIGPASDLGLAQYGPHLVLYCITVTRPFNKIKPLGFIAG